MVEISRVESNSASALLFAQSRALETHSSGGDGFAAYLERVLSPESFRDRYTESSRPSSLAMTPDTDRVHAQPDATPVADDRTAGDGSRRTYADPSSAPHDAAQTAEAARNAVDGARDPAATDEALAASASAASASGGSDTTDRVDGKTTPTAARSAEESAPDGRKPAGRLRKPDTGEESDARVRPVAAAKQAASDLPDAETNSIRVTIAELDPSGKRALIEIAVGEAAGSRADGGLRAVSARSAQGLPVGRTAQAVGASAGQTRGDRDSVSRSVRGDRKNAGRLSVVDLRGTRPREGDRTRSDGGNARSGGDGSAGRDPAVKMPEFAAHRAIDARQPAVADLSADGPSGQLSPGAGAASALGRGTGRTADPASALARALREDGNAEIVRSARMVIRGNDSGEIRLTLRPETLGNVRITLHLQDGHIAGRILVDNGSVRDVFEQNLPSLIQAFEESGLEAGSLYVSVGDGGQGGTGKPFEGRAPAQDRAALFERAIPELWRDDHELVDLTV